MAREILLHSPAEIRPALLLLSARILSAPLILGVIFIVQVMVAKCRHTHVAVLIITITIIRNIGITVVFLRIVHIPVMRFTTLALITVVILLIFVIRHELSAARYSFRKAFARNCTHLHILILMLFGNSRHRSSSSSRLRPLPLLLFQQQAPVVPGLSPPAESCLLLHGFNIILGPVPPTHVQYEKDAVVREKAKWTLPPPLAHEQSPCQSTKLIPEDTVLGGVPQPKNGPV
mmetsp:Transcript_48101/g.145279  ORF Transcript_48101/g.145279 Transcript_48101/m.145279 type:complete len:232 (+) Transcript_48101:447-1142(+)